LAQLNGPPGGTVPTFNSYFGRSPHGIGYRRRGAAGMKGLGTVWSNYWKKQHFSPLNSFPYRSEKLIYPFL